MKKNKMLYRIVAAVLACAVVALALVTYQSRSSSNAPVAEGAVTATGSAKGMEGDVDGGSHSRCHYYILHHREGAE